jgi:predicted house-cleaning noncanonical NTP pyrophosphatase (MazG superfamily)
MEVFETGLTSAGLVGAILVMYKISQSANWSSSCRSRLVDEVEERVKARVKEELRDFVEEQHRATVPRVRGESKSDENI